MSFGLTREQVLWVSLGQKQTLRITNQGTKYSNVSILEGKTYTLSFLKGKCIGRFPAAWELWVGTNLGNGSIVEEMVLSTYIKRHACTLSWEGSNRTELVRIPSGRSRDV